jgi:REP element-mobilizing transposase RayT
MPTTTGLPFPRRYNSLRLLGFDYSSPNALYLITICTDSSRPVFGDIKMAKTTLSVLLHDKTLSRIQVCAYTLMPDHLHLVAGVRGEGKSIPTSIGSFKSLTTQNYWKRSREVVESQATSLPSTSVQKSRDKQSRELIQAVIEWQAVVMPEAVELKNWPRVKPQHFMSKQLWEDSFNDYIIRNDDDLRETMKYIALNPVKRGYVSRPQFSRSPDS